MKMTYLVGRVKAFWAVAICLFAISSCISDGDETVVLETGNAQARKMLLGEWRLASKTVVDENGKEISQEDISRDPVIEFTEDGKCTLKYPDGKREEQEWSLSEDSYNIWFGDGSYEIYTLGKNILVLVIEYGEGRYWKLVFYKISFPAIGNEGGGEIGGTNDKNPYKPYPTDRKVTKIVDDTDIYTFEYDGKGRIMRYKTPEKTYTFTYDDSKVYLWLDGKVVNTGLVGSDGYLTKIWNGTDESNGVSTFTYNSSKYISTLVYKNGSITTSWVPKYSNGNMTSLYGDNSHTFSFADADNYTSMDLNGFITAMYQWEWFMHDPGVIWGLFDFYGKRSSKLVYKETTNQWNNTFSYYYGEGKDDFVLRISQERKGLNTNFNKVYRIYTE